VKKHPKLALYLDAGANLINTTASTASLNQIYALKSLLESKATEI